MTDTAGFSANRLAQILRCEFELGDDTEIYVCFSGGLDSTVLLHSLARIPSIERDRITALHVNHGLHDRAGCFGSGISNNSKRLAQASPYRTKGLLSWS